MLLTGAVFLSLGVLWLLIPPTVFVVAATIGLGTASLGSISLLAAKRWESALAARGGLLAFALLILLPTGYVIHYSVPDATVFSAVLLVALAALFFYYSLSLPLAVLGFAGDERRQQETESPPDTALPSLTVIVPAYNEEDCIGASLDALRKTDYPPDERQILVVDDGSTDGTFREARAHADESVDILRKPNGGKHSALNHGLEHATGDVVVTVDADSLLDVDVLRRVARVFHSNPSVGAVAGDLSVANRGRLVTDLQELEYLVGIQLFRRAYNVFGAVVVVPGAFGAYRRDALEAVGQFDADTLTEDRDATVKILKAGYETRAIDARCLTEAPQTWRDLYKQRLRWYRGTVQTLRKHRDVFRTPSLGALYGFAFPMELFSAAVVPVAGVAIVVSIVVELLYGSPTRVVSLFAFFAWLQCLVSLVAVRLADRDLSLLGYAPLFVVGYRQFLDVVMLKSLVDVLGNRELGWTSPRRTGRLAESLRADADQNATDGEATVAAPGDADETNGARTSESLTAE